MLHTNYLVILQLNKNLIANFISASQTLASTSIEEAVEVQATTIQMEADTVVSKTSPKGMYQTWMASEKLNKTCDSKQKPIATRDRIKDVVASSSGMAAQLVASTVATEEVDVDVVKPKVLPINEYTRSTATRSQ